MDVVSVGVVEFRDGNDNVIGLGAAEEDDLGVDVAGHLADGLGEFVGRVGADVLVVDLCVVGRFLYFPPEVARGSLGGEVLAGVDTEPTDGVVRAGRDQTDRDDFGVQRGRVLDRTVEGGLCQRRTVEGNEKYHTAASVASLIKRCGGGSGRRFLFGYRKGKLSAGRTLLVVEMSWPALSPTTENIHTVASCVRSGGVVVAPSDTNMALTVAPDRPDAIERVYEIKDRPDHKPLTLFVRDPRDWRRFARHDDPAVVDALAAAFWPGPLNLVLERDDPDLDDRCAMDGTVSIGCLANPVWRDLAEAVGGPVAMTSANRSGTVSDDQLVDVELAVDHVGADADYVLGGEPEGTTRASTILSVAGGDADVATVLRQGDLTPTNIERATSLVIE